MDLEELVLTEAFDAECVNYAKARKRRPSSPNDGDSDLNSLWSNDGTSSSISDVETSLYDASRLEAHLYHAGLRFGGRGPKLVYRTSKKIFIPPTGPEAYRRLMKLSEVPANHNLG